jgi:hypothetical protein
MVRSGRKQTISNELRARPPANRYDLRPLGRRHAERRPRGHQLAPLVEQIAAPIGGVDYCFS